MNLLKHSAAYFVGRIGPGLLNLAALYVFTRLLSPRDYGQYALVIAGAGLANSILFQWLRLGLLRFSISYGDRREVFLSTILAGFLALVAISGLLGLLVLPLVADSTVRALVALGIVLLWLEAFFALNLELSRTEFSPKRYGAMAFVRAAVALLFGAALAWWGLGAYGALVGMMCGLLIPSGWHFRRCWRQVRPGLVDRFIFRQLLVYGLPLTATFALSFLINSSDRFLLGWFMGAEGAGGYAVGYDLAKQTLGVLMMVVNLGAYPLAVKALEESGEAAAREQLSQNFALLLLVAMPAGVGLALLAPNIASVLLGGEFESAARLLIPWIAAATVLAGLKAYYFDLSFQLSGRTLWQVWIVLIAALLNIALNLIWIPRYGMSGAAYATLAAYATGLILSGLFGSKVFRMPLPVRDTVKILVATAAMAGCLSPFLDGRGGVALLFQVAWGACVFVVLVVVLNVLGLRSMAIQFRHRLRRTEA